MSHCAGPGNHDCYLKYESELGDTESLLGLSSQCTQVDRKVILSPVEFLDLPQAQEHLLFGPGPAAGYARMPEG